MKKTSITVAFITYRGNHDEVFNGYSTKAPPKRVDQMLHTIRKTRENKGISRRVVEERTGITSRTIASYENDSSSPRLRDLQNISLALGVRLVDLLNLETTSASSAA